jgi:formylglycine-generating enzyme required for sulfatase activity
MGVENYINGGGPNIDELLKQSFLDLDQNNPANDQLFDTMSKDVFGKEWPTQINAQKEAQLLKSVKGASKWPWYLAGMFMTGVITTALVLVNNSNGKKDSDITKIAVNEIASDSKTYSPPIIINSRQDEKQENNTSQNDADTKTVTTDHVGNSLKPQHTGNKLNQENNKINNVQSNGNFVAPLVNTANGVSVLTDTVEKNNTAITSNMLEVTEGMPAITPEIIQQTEKEKEALVFHTANLAFYYAHVSGPTKAGYSDLTFQKDFYLKNTEVTVKEYTTFLNDLLIRGKKEDYEKARPKYKELLSGSDQKADRQFFIDYFTKAHYKNYPVVFISTDGANLYCKWLQELIVKNTGPKFQNTRVRLPNESEWEKAAMGGKKHKYATKNGKIKDWMGPYHANFRNTQENNFTFVNSKDLSEIAGHDVDSTSSNTKSHLDKSEKNRFTSHVESYDRNPYGLYNMSGNVSEMVYDKDRKVITKGGNWNSRVDYLQIQFDDEFMGGVTPSPYIGFRPLITLK